MNYPFTEFRADKYSKDIRLISNNLTQEQRILQSIMISEYRKITAENELNLSIKPVILFKNKTQKQTDENFQLFINQIDNLNIIDVKEIFDKSEITALKLLYNIISNNLSGFVKALKHSFNKNKCLTIYNSSNTKEEKLKYLNTLEDKNNDIGLFLLLMF